MRYVTVKFLSERDATNSQGYMYKDTQSRALKKYDVVVVPTRYGLAMATVHGKYNADQAQAFLDNNRSYGARGFTLETLKSVSEKIKSTTVDAEMKVEKVKDLKAKLEKEVKKIDEVQKFKVYADLSPAVAAMLAELEELNA